VSIEARPEFCWVTTELATFSLNCCSLTGSSVGNITRIRLPTPLSSLLVYLWRLNDIH
jgi:hypothetical protein